MKILVFSYSQSGQLDEILHNILRPLANHTIDHVKIKPLKPFPFPWTSTVFFDAMPETVLEVPMELEPIELAHDEYDLIVLGYQPWFLSPSLPISSLLGTDTFKKAVHGKPVVSVIGSRNMWVNAQTSINKAVAEAGGRVIGNIALIDRTNNLVSAITILHWMLTGKKERKWGILPFPGVSQADIDGADKFGEIIRACMEGDCADQLQQKIIEANGIEVFTNILFIEKRGKMLFRIWAKAIREKGKSRVSRRIWITLFKYYLIVALFFVAPIVLLIYNVLFLPFLYKTVAKEKKRLMLNDFLAL